MASIDYVDDVLAFKYHTEFQMLCGSNVFPAEFLMMFDANIYIYMWMYVCCTLYRNRKRERIREQDRKWVTDWTDWVSVTVLVC